MKITEKVSTRDSVSHKLYCYYGKERKDRLLHAKFKSCVTLTNQSILYVVSFAIFGCKEHKTYLDIDQEKDTENT